MEEQVAPCTAVAKMSSWKRIDGSQLHRRFSRVLTVFSYTHTLESVGGSGMKENWLSLRRIIRDRRNDVRQSSAGILVRKGQAHLRDAIKHLASPYYNYKSHHASSEATLFFFPRTPLPDVHAFGSACMSSELEFTLRAVGMYQTERYLTSEVICGSSHTYELTDVNRLSLCSGVYSV
jgi:hypothetical protein